MSIREPSLLSIEIRRSAVKSGKVGIADAGEVRRGEAGSGVGSADCELVAVEKLDDRLELFDIGVFLANIAEDMRSI
jgi:hypothetical protein